MRLTNIATRIRLATDLTKDAFLKMVDEIPYSSAKEIEGVLIERQPVVGAENVPGTVGITLVAGMPYPEDHKKEIWSEFQYALGKK